MKCCKILIKSSLPCLSSIVVSGILLPLAVASAFLLPTQRIATDPLERAAHCTCVQTVAALKMIEIGVRSEAGSDPQRPQKVNQDSFFVATLKSANDQSSMIDDRYTCVGVLDGHGLKGHLLSKYLAQQLPLHLHRHLKDLVEENLLLQGDDDIRASNGLVVEWEEFEEKLRELSGLSDEELAYQELQPAHHQAMIRAFHSVHWAAMQNAGVPAGRNGATCIVILFDHAEKEWHVAHVGDSRVIQVGISDEDTSDPDRHDVLSLSQETTVKMDKERERIESREGSIRGNNVFYGPVGIAMTRSLGNAAMLRAGVVPTPLVSTFPLLSNVTIVLGTDGIWDVLANDAVAELVFENPNVQAACDAIARAARQKWVGDLPIVDEEKVDDITCMVLRPMG
jgi:serine/threonine protein phosphatase PrpC